MVAIDSRSRELREPSTKDRRTGNIDPANTPKRRIRDTLFNRVRWPAFIGLWFVLGLVVSVYLVLALTGG